MLSSTLTPKGQIAIPAELCHLLDWHPGDVLLLETIDHKIVISKKKDDITTAFGMCQVKKKVSLRAIQKAANKFSDDFMVTRDQPEMQIRENLDILDTLNE